MCEGVVEDKVVDIAECWFWPDRIGPLDILLRPEGEEGDAIEAAWCLGLSSAGER